MTGSQIKDLIISSGVKCWQVAAEMGMNDGNFSRRLRRPFNEDEVKRVKDILGKLTTNVAQN